jgi:hypothetical protein
MSSARPECLCVCGCGRITRAEEIAKAEFLSRLGSFAARLRILA